MDEKKTIFRSLQGDLTFGMNIRIVLFLLIFLSVPSIVLPQSLTDKVFRLVQPADSVLVINKEFSNNEQVIPININSNIFGLTFSGKVRLNSDTSLVRIVLMDDHYKEYLVYETYALMEDKSVFSVKGIGEETVKLNGVKPLMLKFEILDASVEITEIQISTKTLKNTFNTQKETYLLQHKKLIDKINQNIIRKGLAWKAGETSISKMTYQEKKEYFGGKIPNLQGFEYYVGGIFTIPGNTKSKTSVHTNTAQTSDVVKATTYADEFSWRNRHGQDWVTPVKNQGGCGSCWAFATVGATEMLVNLYYNRHLNLNLSEQNLISGTGGSCADGGSVDEALYYVKYIGVVNESCFPYIGKDIPIAGICKNPEELIKIGRYSGMVVNNLSELKKKIIRGPVALIVESWSHAVTLIGYKTIEKGDLVNVRNVIQDSWDYNIPGDSLIGQTAWLIKNSWGTGWGEKGYAYIVAPINDLRWSESLFGPVSSLNLNDSDIVCKDSDGDGYYTWGIGPKPSYCPPCPDEPDGDDSNPCLGPMDDYGNIIPISPPPSTSNVSVNEGDEVPDLVASGEKVKWYSDSTLINLIDTGNIFKTGLTEGCLHTYYVTQTVEGCISSPSVVELSIIKNVPPPATHDTIVCEENRIPDLVAVGENIHWYDDEQLKHLIYSGDSLPTSQTQPGTYKYYATQMIYNCESKPQATSLTINSQPKVDIGRDTTFIPGQVITLKVNDIYASYFWSNGSIKPFTDVGTSNLKSNFQIITLKVSDYNGCENKDSIKIYLQLPAILKNYDKKLPLVIYPNPNQGTFNISYGTQNTNGYLIITLNQF